MAWIAVGAAAVSAAPAIYKGIKGIEQSSQAANMNPVNPGYTMNPGIIANAKTLSDQYGNYTLPGYTNILNNINTNFQNAFSQGSRAATSSGDVLDLATKMAYGKNNALNEVGQQAAAGKQSMLGQYLQAQAEAGQQQVDQNAYQRDQYMQQLRQKAALLQAGQTNTFGAFDQLAGAAGKFGFSQSDNNTKTSSSSRDYDLSQPMSAGLPADYTVNNPSTLQIDDLRSKYGY